MHNDKITCTMLSNGSMLWEYHLYNDQTQKIEVIKLNHKTAVMEIKLHDFQQTARQMIKENLVITYSKY